MDKFTDGMDPDDMPDTPLNRLYAQNIRFNLWRHSGVKPEEIGDKEQATAYAAYLKGNTQ